MKFNMILPYEKDGYRGHGFRRPSVYSGERVLSEVEDDGTGDLGSVTIEFEEDGKGWDGKPRTDFGHLATRWQVITEKNVDAILELFAGALNEKSVPTRWTLPLVELLLRCKGWANLYDNFDILDDQTGFGYMGGTGCGRLIHDLRFSKILGVKPSLKGIRRTLAAMCFNGMLGAVKDIRQENKHLREALTEDQVFVTMNAKPTCQATVAYHNAHGYPVVNGSSVDCSCTKCAKKLGVVANAAGRRRAGAK